jgi:membrane protein DedA with SNARE-associated domain
MRAFQLANFISAFIWVALLLQLGDVGAIIRRWLWNAIAADFGT